MLRPSFVPPAAIRAVRDFTRARQDLVRERTRVLQRLEKLLEDAMVKITAVAADGLKAKSAVAMVQALIGGERDPHKLADLAKGPLRAKKAQLAEVLDGMSGSRHGVIAQALLDQVKFLDQRIEQMEAGAIAALAQVKGIVGGGCDRGNRPAGRDQPGLDRANPVHLAALAPRCSPWRLQTTRRCSASCHGR